MKDSVAVGTIVETDAGPESLLTGVTGEVPPLNGREEETDMGRQGEL